MRLCSWASRWPPRHLPSVGSPYLGKAALTLSKIIIFTKKTCQHWHDVGPMQAKILAPCQSINKVFFIKPFLHQQFSQSAYTETQLKTPKSKQCRLLRIPPVLLLISFTSSGGLRHRPLGITELFHYAHLIPIPLISNCIYVPSVHHCLVGYCFHVRRPVRTCALLFRLLGCVYCALVITGLVPRYCYYCHYYYCHL